MLVNATGSPRVRRFRRPAVWALVRHAGLILGLTVLFFWMVISEAPNGGANIGAGWVYLLLAGLGLPWSVPVVFGSAQDWFGVAWMPVAGVIALACVNLLLHWVYRLAPGPRWRAVVHDGVDETVRLFGSFGRFPARSGGGRWVLIASAVALLALLALPNFGTDRPERTSPISEADVGLFLQDDARFTQPLGGPTGALCFASTVGSDAAHVYALVACMGPGEPVRPKLFEAVAIDVDKFGEITGFEQPQQPDMVTSTRRIFPSEIADRLLNNGYSYTELAARLQAQQ